MALWGCDRESDGDYTKVRLKISGPESSAEENVTRALSADREFGVVVEVGAEELEETLTFVFQPSDIGDDGTISMEIPSGPGRTITPRVFEFYQSAEPNKFPGELYIPSGSEADRTVDLTGGEQSVSITLTYAPVVNMAGVLTDDRTGTAASIDTGCANPNVTFTFDVPAFERIMELVSVTVQADSSYALQNVPVDLSGVVTEIDFTLTAQDSTTTAQSDTVDVYYTESSPVTKELDIYMYGAAQLALTPVNPNAIVGQDVVFTATGGIPPYSIDISINNSASSLSTGSILSSGGQATYHAGSIGCVWDLVGLTDNCSEVAASSVAVGWVPLDISPRNPDINFGSTQWFSASGGNGSYNWSITDQNCAGSSIGPSGTPVQYSSPSSGCTDTIQLSDTSCTTPTTTTVSVESPPTITSSAPNTASELVLYTYNVVCTDPDGDSLSLSVGAGDTCGGGVADNGNGRGTYTFTPGETQGGTNCDVQVDCSDDDGTGSDTTTVTVNETNQNPTWSSPPSDIEMDTDQTYNSPNGIAIDADVPNAAGGDPGYLSSCSTQNDSCSFAVSASGAGAGSATCNLSFTTALNSETCTVDVVATDGWGGTVSQTITITVEEIIYVDAAAAGLNNGASWTDAFVDIQDAMDSAMSGDTIWVRNGIYQSKTASDEAVLVMKNDVRVFGGFDGTEISFADRSIPPSSSTILNGNWSNCHVVIGASNVVLDGFSVKYGNAYYDPYYCPDAIGGGIFNQGINNSVFAYLDVRDNYAYESGGGMLNSYTSGITISDSHIGNNVAYNYGGGIANNESSPTMSYNYISSNRARLGGGMLNVFNSSPAMDHTYFLWNKAQYGYSTPYTGGGAMANVYDSSPVMDYSIFYLNFCYGNPGYSCYGAGMYNVYSSPTLYNYAYFGRNYGAFALGGGMANYKSDPDISYVVFYSNGMYSGYSYYPVLGGGMFNDYSSPVISDTVFVDNVAIMGGGMLNAYYAAPDITDTYFFSNYGYDSGGGMANYLYASPTISYSTFSGNQTYYYYGYKPAKSKTYGPGYGYGGAIDNAMGSYATISFSSFENGRAGMGGAISNRMGAGMTISNSILYYNNAEFGGGMLNVSASSVSGVSISNSVIRGNTAHYTGGGMYNDYSSPDIINCTFYGNYARMDGGAMYNRNYSSPQIKNTIMWNDFTGYLSYYYCPGLMCDLYQPEIYSDFGSSANVSYSDIGLEYCNYHYQYYYPYPPYPPYGYNVCGIYTTAYPGAGVIYHDPLFNGAPSDLSLQGGSWCIDTGDPNPVYNDYNGTRNDMGAYGGPNPPYYFYGGYLIE